MAQLTRRQLISAATGLDLAGQGTARQGTAPSVEAPTIEPRSAWAVDRPPLGPLDGEDVRFLIVHHSASAGPSTTADAPGLLRSFYDYHTSGQKGWNDIAYNFLIDSGGVIWEGRSGSLDGPVAGAATGGNQGFSQLVCMIGNYEEVLPSRAALSSLVSLLAWLADRYDISTAPRARARFTSRGSNLHPEGVDVTTATITGHRTMSRTECPGEALNSYVTGALTADVQTARSGAVTTSTTAPPPSSTTTVEPPSSVTTTLPSPTTTVAEATAAPEGGLTAPTGIITTAGALVVTGAGLLLWRHRRMRG